MKPLRIPQTLIPNPFDVADVPCVVAKILAAAQIEPDDTLDIELIIDAVEEALRDVDAVVCVAEDGDDSGAPAIVTSDGAVCLLYDLNNEIESAFLAFIRNKPKQARELAFAVLAATESKGI